MSLEANNSESFSDQSVFLLTEDSLNHPKSGSCCAGCPSAVQDRGPEMVVAEREVDKGACSYVHKLCFYVNLIMPTIIVCWDGLLKLELNLRL